MQKFDIQKLSTKMNTESDHACVILGAAALDVSLEALLRRNLICHADQLLKNMGPLSTFSSRIVIARALGIICKDVEHDLQIIRKIRNDCAHSSDVDLAFETNSIRDRCSLLRTAASFINGLENTKNVKNNPLSPQAIDGIKKIFDSKMAVSINSRFHNPTHR